MPRALSAAAFQTLVVSELKAINGRLDVLETTPVTPARTRVSEPTAPVYVGKPKLHCVGHGRKRASKACARNFSAPEFLAQHNAWAHSA